MPDTPSPNDTPSCLARLEAQMEGVLRSLDRLQSDLSSFAREQRADFRTLLVIMISCFGAVLAANIGLLGVMAKGFKWF